MNPTVSPAPPETLDAVLVEHMHAVARSARERAYAPYSRFHVGAALLDDQGRVHGGCNVENAAYPQGVCAEAGALSALVLAGGRAVRAVLVVGQAADDSGAPLRPVTPCGGCRQKLREFACDATPVIVASPDTVLLHTTLGALLPHSFGPEHLDQESP